MSLFKRALDKMYKAIPKLLYHVDVEPTNSIKGLHNYVNGIYDILRDHNYKIIKFRKSLIIGIAIVGLLVLME